MKKYSRPTLNTMEIRNSVGRVGCITSRSSFESSAGESPVCLLNSSSPMLLRSRSRRNLLPIAYFLSPVAMVSDSMAIIVFLSLPVPGVFFPLGKSNFPIFFTVKHIFFKIKSWPKRVGR